jgi:hypothetical protein
MYRSLPLALLLLAPLAISGTGDVRGAVIVFSNTTEEPISFTIATPDGKRQTCRIGAGDVAPLPVRGKVGISFETPDGARRYVLEPNTVGYFSGKERLDLVQRSFAATSGEPPAAEAMPGGAPDDATLEEVLEIPVMILVDDDEPAVREVWEAKFRQRVEEASDLFQRYCRVRFKVVAVGTWKSDNAITDFAQSLREFEREVKPEPPARLAIGFTSQYKRPETRRSHMGGTRGPLYRYILIREWSQHVSPSERLEVLVHELGHVLGASHSAEKNSVMRPVVGDRQSRAVSFRIGFDPVNTLAMYLFCEELRFRGVWSVSRFRPATRELLCRIYKELEKELPGDDSAQHYLAILGGVSRSVSAASPAAEASPSPAASAPRVVTPSEPGASSATERNSLPAAVRRVVEAVTDAARGNHQRLTEAAEGADPASAFSGDRLTEYYFRIAAITTSAEQYPPEIASKAFLLGLAVALDDSTMLRDHAVLGPVLRAVESDEQRRQRLEVLGKPTMHGRHDLVEHFVVSAALAVPLGPDAAEAAGTAKEQSDSRGASGFSFVDLSADIAGTAFASRVAKGELSLSDVASGFLVKNYVPDGGNLDEGLSSKVFAERYGSTEDSRFREAKEKIRRRILALPGHEKKGISPIIDRGSAPE